MIAAEIGPDLRLLTTDILRNRNFFNITIALCFVLYLVLNSLAFILLFISLMLLPIVLYSNQ